MRDRSKGLSIRTLDSKQMRDRPKYQHEDTRLQNQFSAVQKKGPKKVCTRKVQASTSLSQKLLFAGYNQGCIYKILQTWTGNCWRTGFLLLNIIYQTHNLVPWPLLKERLLLFWTSLLPTTVFQERSFAWRHLQIIKTPQYLRDIIQAMYTGYIYLLIYGEKTSEEVAPNRGMNRAALWVPFCTPFIYNNDMHRFLTVQIGAATALD